MTALQLLMEQAADLYERTGITLNTFPFRIGNEVRWRIYITDTRDWKIDNPLVNGAYLHYATLEDAIEAALARARVAQGIDAEILVAAGEEIAAKSPVAVISDAPQQQGEAASLIEAGDAMEKALLAAETWFGNRDYDPAECAEMRDISAAILIYRAAKTSIPFMTEPESERIADSFMTGQWSPEELVARRVGILMGLRYARDHFSSPKAHHQLPKGPTTEQLDRIIHLAEQHKPYKDESGTMEFYLGDFANLINYLHDLRALQPK